MDLCRCCGVVMNKEQLEERLVVLNSQLQDAQKRLEQAISDANAIGGAIQEVRYWLEKVAEKLGE